MMQLQLCDATSNAVVENFDLSALQNDVSTLLHKDIEQLFPAEGITPLQQWANESLFSTLNQVLQEVEGQLPQAHADDDQQVLKPREEVTDDELRASTIHTSTSNAQGDWVIGLPVIPAVNADPRLVEAQSRLHALITFLRSGFNRAQSLGVVKG